jgi:hypothetical protein
MGMQALKSLRCNGTNMMGCMTSDHFLAEIASVAEGKMAKLISEGGKMRIGSKQRKT